MLTTSPPAETYYTADYPEDELDSDDEYGLGAYRYRNGNASDDEEYGAFSDGDDDDEHECDRVYRNGAEFYGHEDDNHNDNDVANQEIMARVRRFNRYMNSQQ